MKRLLLLLLLLASSATLKASITLEISAGQLLTSSGSPFPDGGLIQVVASTGDNIFSAPTATSFTGGSADDIVVASFGLNSSSTGTAGVFDTLIHLTLSGAFNAGDQLLLRWYPTLTTASSTPGDGINYGQFRTDSVVDGGTIPWTVPGDGSTDTLSFATSSQGGSQPDSAGTASLAIGSDATAPQITSAGSAEVVQDQPFNYQITASGTPISFGATRLPDGLKVNANSGLISGAPTSPGVSQIALTATNAAGTANATLTLTVDAPPIVFPSITSATTAEGQVGQALSYQITATNNPASFGASGLPAGLSIDPASGVISGTPTVSGTFSIGLSATNPGGTGTAALTLTLAGNTPPPAGPVAPAITSVLRVNGQATIPFSYAITATNNPTSFAATGLPAWLSIDLATGVLSGTPPAAGTFPIGLVASNAKGPGSATLTITVAAAPLPSIALTAPIPQVTAGTGQIGEFQLTRSGDDLATQLMVAYSVKGSAVNGADYVLLKGVRKMKPGKTSVKIKVTPLGAGAGAGVKRVVTLTLLSGEGYTVATTAKVKVKIVGQ